MGLRNQSQRPESWTARRRQIRRQWMVPFSAFQWFWEWVAYALGNWSFLEVLEYLGSFSVLIAVIFYFAESGDRLKQKHYQAWQVINTAQEKGGSGGRLDALQELNADRVPLVGVDVSGAFLQGISLEHARLARCNFSAVDARNSDFTFASLPDADLHYGNFRASSFYGAKLERSNLSDTDFAGADMSAADLDGTNFDDADLRYSNLQNVQWQKISSIKNANLFGAKNPPDGMIAWALQHGAVQIQADEQWQAKP